MDYVYYWYSMLYMLGRFTALFLYAGDIHEAAWMPIEVIRSLPSGVWGDEAQRLHYQIVNERPSLTGMKFFNLTRRSLLTVCIA